MIDPALIRRCRLFSGLTDDNVALLIAIIKKQHHARGTLLFEEGAEADGFYVVASGKVKVFKLSADGRERVLHVILPGDSFADAAIFADGNYPAFASTLVESELLFFPKREFLDLLHSHSQLAINMIAGLSKFLRQFTIQIEDLTFRDVPARLARYLLEVADEQQSDSFELTLAKSQLASNLGTTSETLSRTLRKLMDEELVNVQGKRIEILNADRLGELGECGRDDN